MTERYKELTRISPNLYIEGSPVVIEAGALLKDTVSGKIITQLKIRNLAEKNIIASKVSVRAFEVNGNEIESVDDFSYLDFCASRGASFGTKTPIYMSNDETRSIRPYIKQVVFEDNSIWEAPCEEWEEIPNQESINAVIKEKDLLEQYKLEAGDKAQFVPKTYKGLFLCTCGCVNLQAEPCFNCGITYNKLVEITDEKHLSESLANRLKKEEAEREELKKKTEREQSEKRKKTIRIVIAATAIMAIIVAAFLTYEFGMPQIMLKKVASLCDAGDYQTANDTLNEYNWKHVDNNRIVFLRGSSERGLGMYEEAINDFSSITGYEDSEVQLKEASIEYAKKLVDSSQYEKSRDILANYVGQSDAEEVIKRSYYEEACSFIEKNAYSEARDSLVKAADYGDSKELITKCFYEEAAQELLLGHYETAIELFDNCLSYSDAIQQKEIALNKKAEADYNTKNRELFNEALKQMFKGEFDDVDRILSELPDDYIEANNDIKKFIELWPSANRKYAGFWHSYRFDKKYEDGDYLGLVYKDGKISYTAVFYESKSALFSAIDEHDMDYFSGYMSWVELGNNKLGLYALNDSTYLMNTLVFSADGKKMEEYDNAHPNKYTKEPELEYTYVR